MYDYIIVHGSFGSPFGNWAPWLFDKLTNDREKKVIVPQFPSPEGQEYAIWKEIMGAYKKFIGHDTVIIGHSLAPAFISNFLIESKLCIKGIVYVCPFYGLIGNDVFDAVNCSFFKEVDSLSLLKELVETRICLYSDNDPYVPRAMSEDMADKIDAKKILIHGGGHLNASSGYTEFPKVLEIINEMS